MAESDFSRSCIIGYGFASPMRGGAKQTIAEATAVLDSFTLKVAPVHIMHRGPFVSAIKRGKGVTETVPKGPASKAIKGLWELLNKGAKAKPKGRAAKMERAAR